MISGFQRHAHLVRTWSAISCTTTHFVKNPSFCQQFRRLYCPVAHKSWLLSKMSASGSSHLMFKKNNKISLTCAHSNVPIPKRFMVTLALPKNFMISEYSVEYGCRNKLSITWSFLLKTCRTSFHTANYQQKSSDIKQSYLFKIVANAPPSVRPYLELIRFDRPVGTYLLFFPTAWGTALAAVPGFLPDFKLLSLFFLGAFLMRSAACAVNDVWDMRYDAQVERTKFRPVASGVINPYIALVYAGSLSVLAAGIVLLQLNHQAQLLALCSVPLVLTYPAAKRFTHWPQIMLGVTINWGVLVGFVASIPEPSVPSLITAASVASLYSAAAFWTIYYDSVYAYQDIADDLKIGVLSTAVGWGHGSKARSNLLFSASAFVSLLSCSLWMSGLNTGVLQVGLLACCGHIGWQFYLIGALKNKHNECARAFKSNASLGLIVLLTIIGGRYYQ